MSDNTQQDLSVSEIGLKLIKTYEGFQSKNRTSPTGHTGVGYGHKVNDDERLKLDRRAAEAILRQDLAPFETMINQNVHAPLSQSQFDALVSLAFNIGPKAFLKSDILQALNNGRVLDAASGFDVWRKSEVNGRTYVVDALFRRRTAEKALFLRPVGRSVTASRLDLLPVADAEIPSVTVLPEALKAADKQSVRHNNVDVKAPDFANDRRISDRERAAKTQAFETADRSSRRREDGPLGVLTLSERLDDYTGDRPVVSEPSRSASLRSQSSAQNSYSLDLQAAESLDDIEVLDDGIENGADAINTPPLELPQTSRIAEAAAEVSERLDALIDDTQSPVDTDSSRLDMPESFIEPLSEDLEAQMRSNVVKVAFGKSAAGTDDGVISNRNPHFTDSLAPAQSDLAEPEKGVAKKARHVRKKRVVRADGSRGQVPNKLMAANQPSSLPYILIMTVGLILMVGAFILMMGGSTTLLGANGPALVFGGAIIGAMIVLGASFRILKGLFLKN